MAGPTCLSHIPSPRPHALRPCARQPRGFHFSWNEALYCFARRRPQLTRDPPHLAIGDLIVPASCGHAATHSLPWLLAPATLGRISGWKPDTHSANVCFASCGYTAEHSVFCFASCGYAAQFCTGRPIEEDIQRDLPLLLEGPYGPTQSPSSVLEGSILSPVHSSS